MLDAATVFVGRRTLATTALLDIVAVDAAEVGESGTDCWLRYTVAAGLILAQSAVEVGLVASDGTKAPDADNFRGEFFNSFLLRGSNALAASIVGRALLGISDFACAGRRTTAALWSVVASCGRYLVTAQRTSCGQQRTVYAERYSGCIAALAEAVRGAGQWASARPAARLESALSKAGQQQQENPVLSLSDTRHLVATELVGAVNVAAPRNTARRRSLLLTLACLVEAGLAGARCCGGGARGDRLPRRGGGRWRWRRQERSCCAFAPSADARERRRRRAGEPAGARAVAARGARRGRRARSWRRWETGPLHSRVLSRCAGSAAVHEAATPPAWPCSLVGSVEQGWRGRKRSPVCFGHWRRRRWCSRVDPRKGGPGRQMSSPGDGRKMALCRTRVGCPTLSGWAVHSALCHWSSRQCPRDRTETEVRWQGVGASMKSWVELLEPDVDAFLHSTYWWQPRVLERCGYIPDEHLMYKPTLRAT